MNIDIVTPVYNQVNFTQQYLDCMVTLPAPKFEIFVIDNCSTDNTKAILQLYSKKMDGVNIPKLHIETMSTNVGFAKGSNIGYAKGHGDIVIFLNNDVRSLNNTWYMPLYETILESELDDKLIISPTGGYVDENTYDYRYETKKPFDKFNYLSGWCLAGRRSTFDYIMKNTPGSPGGPFIEKFTTYFEDTFMGFLAKKIGVKMAIVPCPDIFHFGRVTSRTLNISEMYSNAKKLFAQEIASIKV